MIKEEQGFDFITAMRAVCADMVARLPELGHIDLERVALSACQTRHQGSHGYYASLTPLRFEAGAKQKAVRGQRYGVEPIQDDSGREYLYILSFYLPRFLNTPPEEKLSTIVHELWHISPQFDGDLRRHEGRCYAHGHSQAAYDAQVEELLAEYLAGNPPPHLQAFLHFDFNELQLRHARVFGSRIPRPRLLSAD